MVHNGVFYSCYTNELIVINFSKHSKNVFAISKYTVKREKASCIFTV